MCVCVRVCVCVCVCVLDLNYCDISALLINFSSYILTIQAMGALTLLLPETRGVSLKDHVDQDECNPSNHRRSGSFPLQSLQHVSDEGSSRAGEEDVVADTVFLLSHRDETRV